MNLLRLLSILLVVLTMSGCIKDDQNDCPPAFNALLSFKYAGDNDDAGMFAKMIDGVNLYVFDKSGQFVTKQEIDKSALITLQGTQLNLTPGEYIIVCWGNVFENTKVSDFDVFNSGVVNHPNYNIEGKSIPTNDHLYYGKYEVTVPQSGVVSGEILFKGAHINMEIFVQGLGISGQKETYPIIEVRNLMPQYGFDMENRQPLQTTYLPEIFYDEKLMASTVYFQVLRFADDNPIIIDIKDSATKEIKASINLKDFILKEGIILKNKNEVTISILIEFADLGIKITVPNWDDTDITPKR